MTDKDRHRNNHKKAGKPWQLELFSRSIKKKAKFRELISIMEGLERKTCLDIGCGTGVISYHLRYMGGDWSSIDSESSCVQETKDLVKNKVYKRDALHTGFRKNKFDIIVTFYIIEHIEDDDAFLKEMRRILKSNGSLYISTPNTG
ncbi:methyltransferase domain-containing protein, partial [Candidatus Woesearchaeota archaeon]|nr:methyltransferase domain-containing protein [Candidatus Woesearchaeota archaeon]